MTNLSTTQTPTQPASPTGHLMPFGKFRGTPLDVLDPDYLLWLSLLPDLREPLRGAVLREMGRRIQALDALQAPTGKESKS